MAFGSAQRTVFSSILTAQIEENLKLGSAVSYQYEQNAQFAKNVVINTIGDVTIGDYTTAGLSGSLEAVSFTSQSLVLNQQKYFNMYIPAELASATNIDVLTNATRKAAYGLAESADAYIGSLYSGFTTSASVSTGWTIGLTTDTAASSSAYDALVQVGVKLSEQNVPETDRFVAVPHWMVGLLARDSRFTTSQPRILQNGVVENGFVAGMQVLATNNLNTSTTTKVMGFHRDAIAFAAGLNSIEPYVHPDYFGQALRGLYIYGAKVVVPQYGCLLYAVQYTS